MKGVFVKCPFSECNKLLFKDTYLRPGSFLTTRCYHCGTIITATAEVGKLILRIVKVPDEYLTDEDSSAIIGLSL